MRGRARRNDRRINGVEAEVAVTTIAELPRSWHRPPARFLAVAVNLT